MLTFGFVYCGVEDLDPFFSNHSDSDLEVLWARSNSLLYRMVNTKNSSFFWDLGSLVC